MTLQVEDSHLVLHSWFMSIFVASNAFWILKIAWKWDSMVARLLASSYSISTFVIDFSIGPTMELSGMESLKVSLKQSTLIELGNGILVTSFPSMRCYVLFKTFLVA
jgi:hypothetical protein